MSDKKMTNGKFIFHATGPLLTYRLDILKEVCPEARHFLIILTNKFSYDNFYRDKYGDFYEFVLMDEYRANQPISLEYETFPEFMTQEETLANLGSFYNRTKNRFYPYDIQRFIFPYLMEKNILNFTITDSDFIYTDNFELLNDFFTTVPAGTVYAPWHGEDGGKEYRLKLFQEIQPNFPEIKFEAPFLRTNDGWLRGFHFRTIEEMDLLYRVWNSAMDMAFIVQGGYYGHGNAIMLHTEWIISYIMQFFQYQLNYDFVDCHRLLLNKNYNMEIGTHRTRVEDTLYVGIREGWKYLGIDYSDMTSISNFIKNNKEPLQKYYSGTFKQITITDTHVFTKF